MRLRNVVLAAAAAIALGFGSDAMADYFVTPPDLGWSRIGGYYAGSGGEFTLSGTGLNGTLIPVGYVAGVTKQVDARQDFQTFCVEDGEFVYGSGQEPKAVISTTFIDSSGVVTEEQNGSHSIKGNQTYGRNLAPEVAWLYYKFATGTLPSTEYNYTAGSGRSNSANILQQAVWHYMWDPSNVGWAAAAATFTIPTLLPNQISFEETVGNLTKTYTVRVMNLWAPGTPLAQDPNTGLIAPTGNWNDYLRQDMLFMEYAEKSLPVPLPATVWSVGALLGLAAFGRVRRSILGNA